MHKKMGYFNGWKFGVPVMICLRGARLWASDTIRLVGEDKDFFVVVTQSPGCYAATKRLPKENYTYIPIPYKVNNMQPRFPICSNRRSIAYCNRGGRMARLDVVTHDVQVVEVEELRGAKCSAKT